MWGIVKELLADVAPTLGAALGGPFGGVAMSVITDALKVTNPTPQDLANAVVGMTSQQKEDLMAGEQKFTLDMEGLYTKRYVAAQEADTAQSSSKWGWIPLSAKYLVFLVFLGVFVYIVAQAFTGHDPSDTQLQGQVMDLVKMAIVGIVCFVTGKKMP